MREEEEGRSEREREREDGNARYKRRVKNVACSVAGTTGGTAGTSGKRPEVVTAKAAGAITDKRSNRTVCRAASAPDGSRTTGERERHDCRESVYL